MPTSSSGWARFRPQAETELAQLRQLLAAHAPLPAVLSESLRPRLQDYSGFRHFFRNAYSFHFDWAEMGSLDLDCERTLQRFSGEITDFLAKEPPAGDQPAQT